VPLWRDPKTLKWKARFYADGTRVGRRTMKTWPSHLTFGEADRLYKLELAKAAGRRGRTVPRDLTVREALAEYIRVKTPTWSATTTRGITSTMEANAVRLLGSRRIDTLKASDLLDYQATRSAEGAKAASVNRELHLFAAMFTALVRWGWLERHPIPTGTVAPLRAPKGRVDFLSTNEWAALLEALAAPPPAPRGHARPQPPTAPTIPAIRALLYCGARLGEILGLRWRDVDLEAGQVTIERPKTDSITALRISAPLREVLEALPRGTPAAHVFTAPDGSPWRPSDIQKAFYRARDRAGLRRSLSVHSLRHSFASWLTMDGVGLRTVAELLGHTSIVMTQRYTHLAPAHLQEAVDRIGRIEATGKASAVTRSPSETAPTPFLRGGKP
jgi:integrase